MKLVIQKETGLGETCVVEVEGMSQATAHDVAYGFEVLDGRLQRHNAKVVEARQFVQGIKDPNYRYLFTAFLDQFLGLSSQAGSLLQKFGLTPPEGFDSWMAAQDSKPPAGPTVRRIK